MKKVQHVRKREFPIWSFEQVLDVNDTTDACVKSLEERISTYDKETVLALQRADVMVKRMDGESSTETQGAAVNILQMHLVVGQELRTRLERDINASRGRHLKAVKKMNQLVQQLEKSTSDTKRKIIEVESRKNSACARFLLDDRAQVRSRL